MTGGPWKTRGVSQLRIMRVIARMNVGGPAVQISGLMRGLPADRFDQRLYTGWCSEDEADYLATQATDVRAVRVPGLGRALRPGDDARAAATLVREIRRFRPHVIHTHTAKAGVLGRMAAVTANSGAAVVHTFHGHLLHGYFGPAKTRAVVQVERTLARVSDRLIAVGPQVRDDLLAAGVGRPEQYLVIPPGLALPPLPPREDAREALGLPPSGPVLAYIGRLTQIKRPDRFADLVALVHRARPDVTFAVAGEGDLFGDLGRRAEIERLPIRMLGWRDDVETVLAASDAVVLTSDNEGTPLSLIQAGMAGLPVVATDVGAVSSIVHDGVTGWLAAPTAEALATATLAMLGDPTEAKRRGHAAAQSTMTAYSVDRLVADHADLYKALAKAKRQRK